MKCFAHDDRDATATCQPCGKGLCSECSRRFDLILCDTCLLAHNQAVLSQMYSGVAITVIIFAAATYFLGSMEMRDGTSFGFDKAWFLSLLLAFTYWGWKFLSERQRLAFLGNINFWLFYFLIKFALSYFVGLIVGPYQIYKMMKEIRTASKTNQLIARGQA